MIRKIITIDEEKCNGCGLCVNACHEGALQIIDGKAKLISESYCDGLGNCLPECPTGAIEIVEREAAEFDEEAVKRNMEAENRQSGASSDAYQGHGHGHGFVCPGSRARIINRAAQTTESNTAASPEPSAHAESQLGQWPCQIKLVPPNAPYFNNAHLLIAADCTAYAYANMHQDFMKGKITIIGCPKLDDVDYSKKLTDILTYNNIKSITVLRMEVPCCGGIVNAVKNALVNSGNLVPWNVVTISTDGHIIND